MQIEVISAKFLHGNNEYYFSPNGHQLEYGDYAIVDTERGKEIVRITKAAHEIDSSVLEEGLKNVIKIADKDEIALAQENDAKAAALLPEIKKIARQNGLDMKIISVEGNYNGSKITVNFTAENRVDFRDLVKSLAEKYKMRVELRQIGPRDAVRIIGGFGPCGKICCCTQGIGSCDHVSIKMAKNQGLSLNPNSISGLCGKLLCCLGYENGYYAEMLKIMPRVGSFVTTADGQGKVVYCDLMKKRVDVRYQTETTSEIKNYALEEVKFTKND